MKHHQAANARQRALLSRRSLLIAGVAAGTLAGPSRALAQRVASPSIAPPDAMPPAPREAITEILHGISVSDPFRPFEDTSRADVKIWIEAQDRRARAMLEATAVHANVTSFLRQSGRYPRSSPPQRVAQTYLSFAFDGSSEQRWLETRTKPDGPARKLIDPNVLDAEGLTSLSGFYVDRLATKVAYLTAHAGGDTTLLRVRDIRSGQDLLDRLEGCRFSSVAWLPDGNSFYYARPPLPNESSEFDPTSHIVFWHRLGYPQSADRLMLRFRNRTNMLMGLRASYATNQLLITTRIGTDDNNGFYVAPILDASQATQLLLPGRCMFSPIRSVGPACFAITDLDAPRRRIVRMALLDPRPQSWRTIVPQGDGVIDGARLLAQRLVVRHFKDLGHHLTVHDTESGAKQADVAFAPGSRISLGDADRESGELFVEVDDRRWPARIERLDVDTGKTQTARASLARHDLSDAVLRNDAAIAPDGTKIPVTLMHLPDVVADGSNRTLLIGYGGFAISQWPFYSSLAAAWIRLGGIYAVAHIRGGGELGRNWHNEARARRRQTGFNDFRSVAEWLVQQQLTRPDRLGIFGASNGGLLVLTSMLQGPDLYGAVVSGVPVADMLRFHKHTFGTLWKPEYGDPEQADDFKALYAYSPLHNVKAGVKYPPLLILTADNDERVVPAHAYKMAATLMSTSPESEIYLRTRRSAGHGGGNAHSKGIEYQSDIIAFLTAKLGGPLRELPRIET